MEEFIDAIVEYFEAQADIVSLIGHDPANGVFRIGYYVGDIPQELPFLSIRVATTRPLTDSNIGLNTSKVFFTSHSTNPQISSKIVDLVRNLAIPTEIRGYMNISNSRIANPSTTVGRRWVGQKATDQYNKESDVWMDMLEVDIIWSDRACRSNPYDLPVTEYPNPEDERDVC